MIKDKLIQWFKDNEHKFVFYSYRGGMGGEKIVHYLCDETDYFYNRTFEKDFFHYRSIKVDSIFLAKIILLRYMSNAPTSIMMGIL